MVFAGGFQGLARSWIRNQSYDKVVILLLVLVLAVSACRRVTLRSATQSEIRVGALLACASLATALAGRLVEIHQLVFLSFVSFYAGIALMAFGAIFVIRSWPLCVSLLLLVELPAFVTDVLRHPVDTAVASVAAALLAAAGLPTVLLGRMLDFGGAGQIAVLSFTGVLGLVPLLIVVGIVASLDRRAPSVALACLVPALALAGLAVLRIVSAGLLLPRTGIETVERLILYSDALVFALLSAAALGLSWRMLGAVLRSRRGARQPPAAGLAGSAVPGTVTSFAICLSAALVLWSGALPAAPVARAPLAMFPPEMDGWSGTSSAIEPQVARTLMADDYLQMYFWHADETGTADLWIAYYDEQRPGKGSIHSPEVCLPRDGWNILTLDRTTLAEARDPVPANRAVLERNGERILVYYWFEGRGRRDASELRARVSYRLDGFFKGRTDGALVRLMTVIAPGEGEAAADARLRRFALPVVSRLPNFIPGAEAARPRGLRGAPGA